MYVNTSTRGLGDPMRFMFKVEKVRKIIKISK